MAYDAFEEIAKVAKLRNAVTRASYALLATGMARHEGHSEALIVMIASGAIPGVVFAPDGVIAFPEKVRL